MSVINEEKTYNLGVKLTSLPTQNQIDSEKGYTDKSYDSYLIYGTRNQWYSQDRKDVRKILDVRSNIYRVLSSAIRVSVYDGGITAAWLKRQFSNKTFYDDLQNLYRLMYNKKSVGAGLSPLSECVIITHKNKYNIDMFRCPDEAYIIEYASGRKVIKILEKKEQNVEGSVETKLWSGPSLKREYELILGPEFEVFYGFCVSEFLKQKLISNEKKYTTLNSIFNENNIAVLFGDDENYFETLDRWLNIM